jgi:hypothetical protein
MVAGVWPLYRFRAVRVLGAGTDMDVESLRAYLPALGGLLAFLGAALTFVNSRLNEAKDAEDRELVVRRTLEWAALLLAVVGIIVCFMTGTPLAGSGFLALSFLLQCYLFLQNPGPPTRAELLSYGLLMALIVTMLCVGVTIYFIQHLIVPAK